MVLQKTAPIQCERGRNGCPVGLDRNKREEENRGSDMGSKLTVITGLVIPVDWDEQGNPTRTAIFSEDEQRYFVEHDRMGSELLSLLQQEVELEGIVRPIARSENTVTVKSYWLRVQKELWEER